MKQAIRQALMGFFESGSIEESARGLLGALGYHSDRLPSTSRFKSPAELFDYSINDAPNEKARELYLQHAAEAGVVFTYTSEELGKDIQRLGLKNKLSNQSLGFEHFLFYSMEMHKRSRLTRNDYALIAREINNSYEVPVNILFKQGESLTLAVPDKHGANRSSKSLAKISLLRGIDLKSPHEGHVQILRSLSLANVAQSTYKDDNEQNLNILSIHETWIRLLDTNILNEKFYRDISKWYKTALQMCSLPKKHMADEETDSHKRDFVIRMLSRVLFAWFIKINDLIPSELFDQERIGDYIQYKTPSSYYKAILQNLFFATLNQEVEKRDVSKGRGSVNGYLYSKTSKVPIFQISNEEICKLFSPIPYLNGGLFECLDLNTAAAGLVDGFNDDPENALCVPNDLFFNQGKGLIDILGKYAFTVEEAAAHENDVALDPELLGNIFERLLGTYKHTKGQGNKKKETLEHKHETGSYYTPKDVVDYMVDQSIVNYLAGKYSIPPDDLDLLLASCDARSDIAVSAEIIHRVFEGLVNIKVLEPAVGSGAFFMGMLSRITNLLAHIDPDNKMLLAHMQQTESKGRRSSKENISRARLGPNYQRKLYVLRNCLYGVDIQPIAIQIAKLRVFISLAIEQKKDSAKKNLGIKPLPNLETRLIAADTLNYWDAENSSIFMPYGMIEDLASVREEYFLSQSNDEKETLRKKDKELLDNIIEEVIGNLNSKDAASIDSVKAAFSWNLYDMDSYSEYFNPELIFCTKKGFDIIIGNPPYIQLQGKPDLKNRYSHKYSTYVPAGDIYVLFYEHGHMNLSKDGVLCFITSNKWLRGHYGAALRKYLAFKTNPILLIDIGPSVFKASVDTNILLFGAEPTGDNTIKACAL